eukprot:5727154-Pleurochrysis_carterae.AAC.1
MKARENESAREGKRAKWKARENESAREGKRAKTRARLLPAAPPFLRHLTTDSSHARARSASA